MGLSKNLIKQAGRYSTMPLTQKKKFLLLAYHDEGASYAEIAEVVGTYSNKIRRDAKKLGIKSRDKSQAQQIALETGRHKHPTAGTQHSADTKTKIGKKRALAWAKLTPQERERLSQIGKQQWDEKTPKEQKEFLRKANVAIRKTSKEGSQLEKFLHKELVQAGYHVSLHKEHMVANDRLHIDLFIRNLNTAIEVDGPSHFKNIWGSKSYYRSQKADQQKNALVMSKGLVLIRLQQRKRLSLVYKQELLDGLLSTLDMIKNKFPERNDRLIYIGETDD